MTILQFWEIPWKAIVAESYFNTVTGLTILLKQDLTTFQNCQNRYFICNTSKRLPLNFSEF